MKYEIIKKERAFDGFFKIDRFRVKHDVFHEGEMMEKTIEVFERGDACAVLIYEKDSCNLLFTNQFRLPTAEKDQGWIVELVAGMVEENEQPAVSVRREIEEETGYTIDSIVPLFKFYVSPGGSSERIFLFYAETNSFNKIKPGGGKQEEGEDIELLKIPASEIANQMPSFIDAKTIIALQWFLLNKKDAYLTHK